MFDAQSLTFAIAWIEKLEALALRSGEPLSVSESWDASTIGVRQLGKVRLLKVDQMPRPDDSGLRIAADKLGLITAKTWGLAAQFGILIRADRWRNRRTIAHELVHVRQYEQHGGVRPFLETYLDQCDRFGYLKAPLEIEAEEVSERLFTPA